ncbi:MAG: hypothetical protein KA152_13750 [Verrucomicrobiales bacterium]|nr:hypothetical protein [Verrucomicrobiales bacterium]
MQLYDIEADVAEAKDVAAANPETVQEIERIMEREHTASGAFPFRALDGQ